MKTVLSESEFRKIPAGVYVVQLVDVEKFAGSQYGPALKWIYSIVGGEFDGIKLNKLTSEKITKENKAGKHMLACFGRYDVDLADVRGTKFHAKLEPNEKGFAQIVGICAYQGASSQPTNPQPTQVTKSEPVLADEEFMQLLNNL